MKRFIAVLLVSIFTAVQAGFTCTTFSLKSQDGSIVVGRSNEFGMDLQNEMVVIPRGFNFASPSPDKKEGLKWKAKYGFLGINAFGQDDAVMDGMNEAGLSVGELYLTDFAGYQKVGPKDGKRALAHIMVASWILSNFAAVDEVKEAVKNIIVFNYQPEEVLFPLPLHYAVHDAKGGCIVIEYVKGELNVYDNPVGVMTNAPPFDWQLINLKNYVNLTSVNADSLILGSYDVKPTGQGSGLLGIPGDFTPPSRFVRTALLAHSALPAKNAEGAVNAAFHILNAVDIPLGSVAQKVEGSGMRYEQTDWVVVRDLANKVFYFRTYNNLAIGRVDLKQLDFSGAEPKHISLDAGDQYVDLNDQVK